MQEEDERVRRDDSQSRSETEILRMFADTMPTLAWIANADGSIT